MQHIETAQPDLHDIRKQVEHLRISGKLRGERLNAICRFLTSGTPSGCPPDLQWVLLMPRFLNLCFVEGPCNSDCRMCSAERNHTFSFMSATQCDTIIKHAETATDLCFSSGSSDPLLNPDLPLILKLLADHECLCDLFSNGLALRPSLIETIVQSRAVNMINLSFDAATPETYRRIRRRDLAIVQQNLATLQDAKKRVGTMTPRVELSMVAMNDNIHELPQLVEYAGRVGAFSVFVQNLIQHNKNDPENKPATTHPEWKRYVVEATNLARNLGLSLQLPANLQLATAAPKDQPQPAPSPSSPEPDTGIPCCSWLRGIWIASDGRLSPCCMNHDVEMGNIFEESLITNSKYHLAKMKLMTGRVFRSCLKHVESCAYLTALAARGLPPAHVAD